MFDEMKSEGNFQESRSPVTQHNESVKYVDRFNEKGGKVHSTYNIIMVLGENYHG